MPSLQKVSGELLAVRCHDVTVSLGTKQVAEFDRLVILGMAVRLALHLRGVPAVRYDLLRQVGLHLLQIPPTALSSVVEVLGEAEFVRIARQGSTIRSIVPTVPYYEDLFTGMGEVAQTEQLSEPEQLTLAMLDRLAKSPTSKNAIEGCGADANLVDRTIDIGEQGGYIIEHRARGRDMLVSPVYFSENADAFADLAAGQGSGRVAGVINLLSQHQGWPLNLIRQQKRIGEVTIDNEQLKIVVALAGKGFSPPPAINTEHAGDNHFLFSPKPSSVTISPTKRQVYEAAMALVAAVRQGQLLPAKYAIRHPSALLTALKERKALRANTEAIEQYQKLVTLRLGRLVPAGGKKWAIFELIDVPENIEAVEMAIALVSGESIGPTRDEEVAIAFRKGQSYVESLVGRQLLVEQSPITLDAVSKQEIDDLLLRGTT